MTLFDVNLLFGYWQENPPTEALVRNIAIWAGAYKPSETIAKPTPKELPDPRKELAALFKTDNFEQFKPKSAIERGIGLG